MRSYATRASAYPLPLAGGAPLPGPSPQTVESSIDKSRSAGSRVVFAPCQQTPTRSVGVVHTVV